MPFTVYIRNTTRGRVTREIIARNAREAAQIARSQTRAWEGLTRIRVASGPLFGKGV